MFQTEIWELQAFHLADRKDIICLFEVLSNGIKSFLIWCQDHMCSQVASALHTQETV